MRNEKLIRCDAFEALGFTLGAACVLVYVGYYGLYYPYTISESNNWLKLKSIN